MVTHAVTGFDHGVSRRLTVMGGRCCHGLSLKKQNERRRRRCIKQAVTLGAKLKDDAL
jgi:hypothetical protein